MSSRGAALHNVRASPGPALETPTGAARRRSAVRAAQRREGRLARRRTGYGLRRSSVAPKGSAVAPGRPVRRRELVTVSVAGGHGPRFTPLPSTQAEPHHPSAPFHRQLGIGSGMPCMAGRRHTQGPPGFRRFLWRERVRDRDLPSGHLLLAVPRAQAARWTASTRRYYCGRRTRRGSITRSDPPRTSLRSGTASSPRSSS
jgi:hypothetical protein